MTIAQFWGSLVVISVCPILGGLPLISWIAYAITGRQLSKLGTGNISVSAAFYHGGKLVGILAVLSEALKGITAVLLSRAFFPSQPVWELIALIALVIGRYWIGKGAGTTNAVWGIVIHDPISAGLIFSIGAIGFALIRNRTWSRLAILVLLVAILALRHPQEPERIIAAIALSGLLAWITHRIPDDLDLPASEARAESQKMFRFFQGDKKIVSLNRELDASQVGQKAANLSHLKHWGYSVPDGWVLPAGEEAQPLIEFLQPSEIEPLVVRSSAVGEDSELASAAGQYTTILNVTSREQLKAAILDCQASYNNPNAAQYRQDRQQSDKEMAVLIQKQVKGVVSGVAFSRDPIDQLNGAVVIEALPDEGIQVVSGQITPQQYRVYFHQAAGEFEKPEVVIEGSQDDRIPEKVIEEVALVAREIEELNCGIPQDIEWTYDGEQLWLLQARPITTLLPIWTRKIAAEVIPGSIKTLTWSINRPLTCGVWGEIFTIVLGKRAQGLDFTETATLHFSRAYFNATLLGEIFCRMGLPKEGLEFLTRGAKFSKPPLKSTLRNLPGLIKLVSREWYLERDFYSDKERYFIPTLNKVSSRSPEELSPQELLERVETILSVLKQVTYYSILAPLSLAVRQAIFKVPETELDNSQTPEIESMRSLACLAEEIANSLPIQELATHGSAEAIEEIAQMPDGKNALEQFDRWLERYGYLSEVGTDIAIPRWQEDPQPLKELFTQFLLDEEKRNQMKSQKSFKSKGWKTKLVQKRLTLKGQLTEVYTQLLAHLRWSFLALEQVWLREGVLGEPEDIFFLEYCEIQRLIKNPDLESKEQLSYLIRQRRIQLEQHQKITSLPYIIYGNPSASDFFHLSSPLSIKQQLQGIAASPGQVEGRVKVMHNLRELPEIDRQTILVVPYTDSGWAPWLARAGGIIAEVGGRLSHGAIVAREYSIPAVMDVGNATQMLQDGQRVRIDGQRGVVEILED